MSSETVDITTPDGTADAYVSRPDGGGSHPAVLFVVDAIGMRPRIEEMADRIASQGYVVLAPNIFYRDGRAPVVDIPDLTDPANRGPFFQTIRPIISKLTPDAIDRDSPAYLDFLAEVAPGPVGITGYCMGARVGWRIAATHPDRVAGLGGFHAGGLVTDNPDSPHRSAESVAAEVYFGHADEDPSMTPEQIAALDQAMADARVPHRSEVYAGAAHGYTMSDTAAWNEAACERHFEALFGLLGRTLSA